MKQDILKIDLPSPKSGVNRKGRTSWACLESKEETTVDVEGEAAAYVKCKWTANDGETGCCSVWEG